MHLTHIGRTVAQVDGGLRKSIRALVSAELPWPLFLHGPAGTGKTSAALCMLDHATPVGRTGEYVTVAGLCAALIECQQGRLQGATGMIIRTVEFWQRFADAPLVVLDEIGTRESVSDAHYEAVKAVIDARHGKPFVAIANVSPERIESLYDARIYSRIAAGTVIELSGKDRRTS